MTVWRNDKGKYAIWFWDFDHWDQLAVATFDSKAEAAKYIAEKLEPDWKKLFRPRVRTAIYWREARRDTTK